MAKQNAIEKAIANLKSERAVLDAAIAKLEQQQTTKKPAKGPRAVKPVPMEDKSA